MPDFLPALHGCLRALTARCEGHTMRVRRDTKMQRWFAYRLAIAVLGCLLTGQNWQLRGQSAAAEPAKYEVTFERNVAAKMRDGVTLRADIYRPKADGNFPVLLERTPYDKNGGREFAMRAA